MSETKTHCTVCGSRLKLLYSSWFCPRECDKKRKTEPDKTFDIDWEWDQDKITKPMGAQLGCGGFHVWMKNPLRLNEYVCKYCLALTQDLVRVY